MMNQEPFRYTQNFEVVGWKTNKSGEVTAEIRCYDANSSWVCQDKVRLWKRDERQKFVKLFLQKTKVPEAEQPRHLDILDEQLCKIPEMTKQKDAEAPTPKKGQPTEETPALTEDERKLALAVLQDLALFFTALTIMKLSGIVGEEENLLTLYLVMTSRLLKQPLSAATKGESSAGKSALDKIIRKFFSEGEAFYFWSAMSKQNLYYTDKDFKHRILVVAESVGAEDASYAVRTILSENCLVFEVVEKDESGKSVSRQIRKDGPTGFVTTTTLPKLHPENETRLVTLAIDESEEQTSQVKESIATEFQDGRPEPDFVPWVSAQRMLVPVDVKIPYARFLLRRLPNKPLRMRRDCRKLLSFISASAALHQFQRERTDDGKVIANLADYFNVKVLFENIFFQSLYGVHPNTQT
jgi:hypothetical protein